MAPAPKRIGVLGGTFDPPHNAHLAVAAHARDQLSLDRVLLVVANQPWQKVGERAVTPAADRLAMVEAMVADVSGLEASDIDIARGGLTYTADTMGDVAQRWPASERWLVVGSDVARSLHTWERLDEVKSLTALALVVRGDTRGPDASLGLEGWHVAEVSVPRLDIASSEIRRRVRESEPIDGLAHPAAIRFIRERGLYAHSG